MLVPAQPDMFDAIPPLRSRRRQRFVDAVLAGKSAREAIEASGSTARGHSADVLASRWLKKVDVSAHLDLRRRLAIECANIDAAQVLREVGKLAFSATLSEFPRFKVSDKLGALRLLAEHCGVVKGSAANVNVNAIAAIDTKPRSDLDIARRIAFLLAEATVQGKATSLKAAE
jgi:hypothetical protein